MWNRYGTSILVPASEAVTDSLRLCVPIDDYQRIFISRLKMNKLNPPVPTPKCEPYLWEYDKIRPALIKAGKLVTEKQAERRVLMLINPASEAPETTDTLYAGIQLVMPGETAPAHRHSAFALRFIIEGQAGFTAVQGRRFEM